MGDATFLLNRGVKRAHSVACRPCVAGWVAFAAFLISLFGLLFT